MKKPTTNTTPKPPRRLVGVSLKLWEKFTKQLRAEGRLHQGDLEALALCCAALGILDAEPTMEHLAEARAWMSECGLTPASRIMVVS